MGRLRVSLLGPLEVRRDGELVALAGGKPRALLAVLALHAGRPVMVDRIVDALWAGRPPAGAAKVVQVYVSQLRRALGRADAGLSPIVTERSAYRLAVSRTDVDALCFEDLVATSVRSLGAGRPAEADEVLGQALVLWRDQPLADFELEPFAQPEIARLLTLHRDATVARAEAALALGRHREAVADLERLLARDPVHEPAAVLLMLALYRSGRQADALDMFRAVRATLVEELGVEPGLELRSLQRKVLTQDDSLRWRPPRGHPTPHNIPSQLTSFVGRQGDVEEVRLLLHRHRLVTLTGAGGCGKSRLALEVATGALAETAGGVWFVDLSHTEETKVPQVLAETMGCPEGLVEALTAVMDSIGDQPTLLLMDNTERVAHGCAVTVRRLLRGCPCLSVLVTSQQALAIPEEVVYEVGPLQPPGAGVTKAGVCRDYPAVQLFSERAASVRSGFVLDDEAAGPVAQICRRLDGMPLALELAAACIRTMSPLEIAERLDDRFRLLAGGDMAAVPRQRTLLGALEWSYDLLEPAERQLLDALSVFAGTFDLSAVEAVCGEPGREADVDRLLVALVCKSLVHVERAGSRSRHRLLESVRAYAAKQLEVTGRSPSIHARHAEHFLRLAESVSDRLRGSGQRDALGLLEVAWENFRTAMRWFTERSESERQARLAAALWRACYLSGRYSEGRWWLETALKHENVSPVVRADVLVGAGALAFYQCDYDTATAYCLMGSGIYRELRDDAGVGMSLTLLGGVSRERASYQDALARHREAGERFALAGDSWGVAHSLQMAGFASWLSCEHQRARDLSGQALERFRQLGDQERAAWALLDLGAVAHYEGDAAEARLLLEQALQAFEELGFQEGVAWASNLLGLVASAQGRYDESLRQLRASLVVHRELGDKWRICSVLEAISACLERAGETESAATLLGGAGKLRGVIGTPVPLCERPERYRLTRRLTGSLGREGRARLGRRGAILPLDQLCRLAEGGSVDREQPSPMTGRWRSPSYPRTSS